MTLAGTGCLLLGGAGAGRWRQAEQQAQGSRCTWAFHGHDEPSSLGSVHAKLRICP